MQTNAMKLPGGEVAPRPDRFRREKRVKGTSPHTVGFRGGLPLPEITRTGSHRTWRLRTLVLWNT